MSEIDFSTCAVVWSIVMGTGSKLSVISTVVMSRLVTILFPISEEINPKSLVGTASK